MDNPYVYVPHGSPTMTLSGRVSVARGAELGAFRWAGGEGGVETKWPRGSGYVTDTLGAHVGQHGKGLCHIRMSHVTHMYELCHTYE